MEMLKKLFTKIDPNPTNIMYMLGIAIIIAFSLLCYLKYSTKEKIIKHTWIGRGRQGEYEKYDWDETIKRYKENLVIIISALTISIASIYNFG